MIGVGREGPLGVSSAARGDGNGGAGTSGEPASEPGSGPRVGLQEREALAVLASVDGLGPVTLARLIDRLGSARAVLETALGPRGARNLVEASREPGEWSAMAKDVAAVVVAAADRGDEILRGITRANVHVVTLEDADYPLRLRAIELPPHVLFIQGSVAALAAVHSIAVVGTRRPSDAGRRNAARIGAALVRAGATVVSGLAIGIDGAAHAAVVAERGTTVAVLGGGHDHLYPRGHRRLADAIVAGGGAVVSELPPAVQPTPGTFPRRNRVISGLSDATIVVEAPARSGALLTASWALEQGRGCFLVPGPIDSRTSAGCLSFLRECHDEARIVAGIPQLIEDLGLANLPNPLGGDRPMPPPVAAVLIELGEGARMVAAALVAGRATADELVAETDLPIAAVLAALTLLEGRGLAVSAYGRYRPAGRLAAEPAR